MSHAGGRSSEPPERRKYIEQMGREPRNLPEDHPDYWQWVYTGSAEDRERLMELLQESSLADQESLF